VFKQKVSGTAETVEKVQMANSDNFCTVKTNNLQATENRKMPDLGFFDSLAILFEFRPDPNSFDMLLIY
jgi:hypothetical protein